MNSDGYYDRQEEFLSRREDYSEPHEETEVLIDDEGVAKTVTVSVLIVFLVLC